MLLSSLKRLTLALGAVCAFAGAAQADVFRATQFNFMAGEESGTYELSVGLPENAPVQAAPILPKGCRQTSADQQSLAGENLLVFEIECERPLTPSDKIVVPWNVDGALFASSINGPPVSVAVETTQAGVELPIGRTAAVERPLVQVAADYLWQGVVHILLGWDHLAFVLCLCLLTRGKTLLALITTFTIGHSLSLALAFFEVVTIPVPPVEAVIALSIAFMAREALRADPGADESRAIQVRYMTVVGAFGLLHGLGFASVLGELGVVQAERVPGLIFFNLGVEAGQLLFVGVVTGVMWAARQVQAAQPVRMAALYGAGALGLFWVFERVVGFGFTSI